MEPNSWPWNSIGVLGASKSKAVRARNRPGLVSWTSRWPRPELAT